ncbi:MAG: gamma-glutamylcyclotransferase family protein [Dyadobacter fermentans]
MKTFIFGYGSLINLSSLSRTMQQEMVEEDIIPVKLRGFTRIWNLKAPIFSDNLKKEITGMFLNIRSRPESWVNGVIFEVSEEQLKYLDLRERNYSRLDVTADIEPYQQLENGTFRVLAYIATGPEFLLEEATGDSFVMTKYVNMVESGCAAIGDFFLQDYQATTATNPFPLLMGDYSFTPNEALPPDSSARP